VQPGAEKRQHDRVPLEVEVDFSSETNFYNGFTENISEGGLFVATWEVRKLGDRVALRFRLPDSTELIECQAEVRWLREQNPDTPSIAPGIGLRFLDLSPAQQRRVEEFLREREPLFYDE
jgi:uncharacterized protein (TIGR02266 family)